MRRARVDLLVSSYELLLREAGYAAHAAIPTCPFAFWLSRVPHYDLLGASATLQHYSASLNVITVERRSSSLFANRRFPSAQGGSPWDYEEFEQGEAVLSRLKWLEKGKEGLLEELSEELDALEGGTIQQVCIVLFLSWSGYSDGAPHIQMHPVVQTRRPIMLFRVMCLSLG